MHIRTACMSMSTLISLMLSGHTIHTWKPCSNHSYSDCKDPCGTVFFFNKLRSKTTHSPFPLVEQWGIKLNAFHKRELPAHLLQLAASKQKGNSSMKKKKNLWKEPTQANRNSLELFCWVSRSSCYTLNSPFTIVTCSRDEKQGGVLFYIFTYMFITLMALCLHLLNLISINSFCSLHKPFSFNPLKLTCNSISLMFQSASTNTFPGNLLSSSSEKQFKQQRAGKINFTSPYFIKILPAWREHLPNILVDLIDT